MIAITVTVSIASMQLVLLLQDNYFHCDCVGGGGYGSDDDAVVCADKHRMATRRCCVLMLKAIRLCESTCEHML